MHLNSMAAFSLLSQTAPERPFLRPSDSLSVLKLHTNWVCPTDFILPKTCDKTGRGAGTF